MTAAPPPQQSPVSAEREGALLALPLVVCLLNLGAPYLFRGLAALERHDSPGLEVYVAICRCVAGGAGGAPWDPSFCLPGTPPSASAPHLHRNLILKMVILGILCYHWLGRRVGALKDQVRAAWARWGQRGWPALSPTRQPSPGRACPWPGLLLQCWENFVGQELYRLTVVDFLFMLLDTLFGELLWR